MIAAPDDSGSDPQRKPDELAVPKTPTDLPDSLIGALLYLIVRREPAAWDEIRRKTFGNLVVVLLALFFVAVAFTLFFVFGMANKHFGLSAREIGLGLGGLVSLAGLTAGVILVRGKIGAKKTKKKGKKGKGKGKGKGKAKSQTKKKGKKKAKGKRQNRS